jgi:N-acetylglucosaminyldiphosphoundecaprenol N-acetyl-beta-D-mannosaminyltransferase
MKLVKFNDISFYDIKFNHLIDRLNNKTSTSLVLLPSAPGLSSITFDKKYYQSLKGSTFNLFDSGLFCLLLRSRGVFVKKNSGFLLILNLINFFKQKKINSFFFVDPNMKESKKNQMFVNSYFSQNLYRSYISPIYKFDNPVDLNLLKLLNQKKPRYLIINLGGGIQEKLGYWLKKNLNFKCIIFCTGAAIAFHTKSQAPITNTIDRFYLGWLARCIYQPLIFIPRYLKAFKFLYIFLKFYKTIKINL